MEMSESKRLYYNDRKGDRDVLTYGTLYKYDVPKYSKKKESFCIGLPPTMKLVDNELREMIVSMDEKSIVCHRKISAVK
jgi:hypothetical protein